MVFTTADKAGLPSRLFNSDKKDLAPRIGAAFRLNNKTVLRGSYGVYYWAVPNTQNLASQTYSAPLNMNYIAEPDYWNSINYYDVTTVPSPESTRQQPGRHRRSSIDQRSLRFHPLRNGPDELARSLVELHR